MLSMVKQRHCLLNVTVASILCRYLQCTGGLLDSAHILTAAHCVWNIEATSSADRTYVSTLNFYPGMNGGSLSANALGVYTWHSVKVLSEFTDQTVRSFRPPAPSHNHQPSVMNHVLPSLHIHTYKDTRDSYHGRLLVALQQ